ncbi:unnamed protein product, partial [Meganyctiphanes norvegica]
SYVELVVLVSSIFSFATPQIRNLSPLMGKFNRDLPGSFENNIAVPTFASFSSGISAPAFISSSSGSGFGEDAWVGGDAGFDGDVGFSGGNGIGQEGIGFGGGSGSGGNTDLPDSVGDYISKITAEDVEEALMKAFKEASGISSQGGSVSSASAASSSSAAASSSSASAASSSSAAASSSSASAASSSSAAEAASEYVPTNH